MAAAQRWVALERWAPYLVAAVISSGTAIMLGFRIIHSAFFVSILEIRASRPTEGTVPVRSAEAASSVG